MKMGDMGKNVKPQIQSAERFGGDLIITFQDGLCAIYSAQLLFSIIDQAKRVAEPEDDSDESTHAEAD